MKECNSCGKCCIKYSNGGLTASKSEIELWDVYSPHVFQYVKDGEIWVDPKTHQPLELCPWLKEIPGKPGKATRYSCDIYFDRPDDCKFYPVTVSEMILDECEMIEKKDLANPKKAQVELDKIMEDSRSVT